MHSDYLLKYLSPEATNDHMSKLRGRITSINQVIERHMEWLMRQTKYTDPVAYNKFMSKTVKQKIDALITNEKVLRREVSKGEFERAERLRMITITQSYNILDSQAFREARQMKRYLELERLKQKA